MTGKYPFPDDIRNPNRKDPNPFAAEDPTLDEAIDSDAPYVVGDKASQYKPEYDAVLTDRSGLTLLCGIFGLAFSLSGWLVLLDGRFAIFLLMPLFSLAGSLPALLISISDLRAMAKGAMKTDHQSWARVSLCFGLLGLFSSGLYGGYWLWNIWYSNW